MDALIKGHKKAQKSKVKVVIPKLHSNQTDDNLHNRKQGPNNKR